MVRTKPNLLQSSIQPSDPATTFAAVPRSQSGTGTTPTSKDGVENGDAQNRGRWSWRGRWTKQEDETLRNAVGDFGARNWKRISIEYFAGNRSDVQCLHRWQKVLKPGLVKGPWTKEEDEVLTACITNGITKWSEIAAQIPGRIGKQCRERWFNHLDPYIQKGDWTAEEEEILTMAHEKHGNKWSLIARLLPGRGENAVKNRWNSKMRKRAAPAKPTDDNKTSAKKKTKKGVAAEGGKRKRKGAARKGVAKEAEEAANVMTILASGFAAAADKPVDKAMEAACANLSLLAESSKKKPKLSRVDTSAGAKAKSEVPPVTPATALSNNNPVEEKAVSPTQGKMENKSSVTLSRPLVLPTKTEKTKEGIAEKTPV